MSEGVWIWRKRVPKERDMFSEFSLRGRWWLPSNPNDQVPGVLHFSKDGIRLRLDRSFWVQELMQAYSIGSYKTDAVLGYTTDSSPCTVLTVFYLSAAGEEVVLGANAILMGTHCNSEKNLTVQKAVLGFTHLEEWTGRPLIKEVHGSDKDHFFIQVPTAVSPVFKIEGCPQFKSLVFWHGLQISRRRTQTTLKNQSHFQVEFDVPAKIPQVNRVIRGIASLLSLLVGDPVDPKKAQLNIEAIGSKTGTTIEYLVPPRAVLPAEKSEFEMIFPLRDFEDGASAEDLFREWFLKEPILRSVYDLLLSTLFNRSQYFHSAFLSLAQALESFHRKTREGSYISKDEYEKIRKTLASVLPLEIPKHFREKLLSSFAYGNELSLKTRIRQLLDNIDPEHAADLAGNPDLEEFIRLIAKIRNYLTHYDENNRPAIIDNVVEMFNLNQRLRAILVFLLFKYLGLHENRLFIPIKSHLRLF